MFPDDTSIFFQTDSKSCHNELQATANQVLETFNDYMCSNKLTLNIKKTVAILFTPPSKKALPIKLSIGNSTIEQVKETKFLGITIDEKLKFNTHFNNVVNKAKKGLYALVQTKNLLSYAAKLKIYHGLIHCHLSYCPIIWLYDQPLKNVKILETLQKKALRLIFKAKPNSHTENMFIVSNVIKVKNLCLNDKLNFMYKHRNNSLPSAISEIIQNAEENLRPVRAKSNTENAKSYTNTGNIAYDLLSSWNNLEDPIKTKKFSIKTVKKRIKLHLQLTSESNCIRKQCHACQRTPNFQKLAAYTHFIK